MISRQLSSRLTSSAKQSASTLTKPRTSNHVASSLPSSNLAVGRRPLSYSAISRTLFLRPAAQRWSQRRWPLNSNAIHNLPAVRHASFARVIPSLAMKLFRIPAMFGAAMIGGVAYLQYQAAQAGTWAVDTFGKAKDAASNTANGVLDGVGGMFAQMGKGWGQD